MPAGRPSDYETDFAEQAKKLCQLGATDMELADFFTVDVRTIYRWKNQHEDFCQAVTCGKEAADERVARSLFNRAVGYNYSAVKIFMPAGAEAPVYADYIEHVPPDTGAAFNWLKNRRPTEWRDVKAQELSGPGGAPLQTETKVDMSALTPDQIRAIASIKLPADA